MRDDEESARLSFDDSPAENRLKFINRLVLCGWPEEEAEQEHDRIQAEEEGEL